MKLNQAGKKLFDIWEEKFYKGNERRVIYTQNGIIKAIDIA